MACSIIAAALYSKLNVFAILHHIVSPFQASYINNIDRTMERPTSALEIVSM